MEEEKRLDEYEHNSTMLYVGNLDTSVSDDDLYQHFNQFPGLVVWCRHIMNFKTNQPRGYGFVNYNTPRQAANAIKLANSTLLKNKSIEVKFSPYHLNTIESLLFISNLDKSVDKTTLNHIFSNYGKILYIKLSTNASGYCSRGYATLQYNCFASAQSAIEHLDGALIHNKQIDVSPFLSPRDTQPPGEVAVIFSSQSSASKYHLHKFFSRYGPIACVSEATHHKGERFGFVTFENPEDADRAIRDAPDRKWFIYNLELYGASKDKADQDQDQVDLKQLHVNNLDEAINDHSLKALFSYYGTLYSCKVLRDPDGISTGSGLVAYSTNQEASRALRAMNGKLIVGKALCITLEEARRSRPKMPPLRMTAMTPQPPFPLPMYPPLLMQPSGNFGLGQQMYPPGGFCLGFEQGFGQQMYPPGGC